MSKEVSSSVPTPSDKFPVAVSGRIPQVACKNSSKAIATIIGFNIWIRTKGHNVYRGLFTDILTLLLGGRDLLHLLEVSCDRKICFGRCNVRANSGQPVRSPV